MNSESIRNTVDALKTYLINGDTLVELGVIAFLAVVALVMSRRQAPGFDALNQRYERYPLLLRVLTMLDAVLFPLDWLILQWIANLAFEVAGWRDGILFITASLLTAWVVIRIASSFIHNASLGRTVATLAWTITALNILGLLPETMTLLDHYGVTVGDARITLLTVITGSLTLILLLWASSLLSEFFDSRIRGASEITPSAQELFSKLMKVGLVTVALLVSVRIVGIDLTAFAVVGGAIGVGIGFGLQKIVSNLISGVILLLDNSIKPGDVIAVDDYYGRVNSLGARYVSVRTLDGVEHLIPNEELIVNSVENWTHSDNMLRLHLPIGVHYNSDIHKARELCIEAAAETQRVLKDPSPVCHLRGFGDNSVNLELRFWIDDPMNGRANVSSDILLKVWDKFHAEGIEIPYPQRDVHLRTPAWDSLKAALADPKTDSGHPD